MPTKHYDVLIVGCGPVGATLANLLRESGRSVAVFDRDKDVFHCPRAMMFDPESCRIYQRMGIMERMFPDDAKPFQTFRMVNHKRKTLVEMDYSKVPPSFGHSGVGTMFHQPTLERLLREDFKQGVKVDSFLGYEVLSVESGSDHATLTARNTETGEETEFTGAYIVGSDGGASLCRRSIGAKRIDFNYRRKWIVIDVVVHDRAYWDGLEDFSEFMCRPNGATVFVKGCRGHLRFDFEIDEHLADQFTHDDAIAHISNYIDTSSIEIQRCAPYNFYAGMPNIWRKDRILLAGDAAHQTSPFAGQGLNMGLRDAAHLSFLFDLIFDGKADDSILDTYHEERWPHCEKVINRASRTGLQLSTTSKRKQLKRNFGFWLVRMFPKLGGVANSDDRFPAYKAGLIGTGHRLCGRRLCQPEVVDASGHRTLLDEVIGHGFALLVSEPAEGESISWFKGEFGGSVFVIGKDFLDTDGKLTEFTEGSAVLVRPDRYIFGANENGNDLCASFQEHLRQYQS